MRNLLALSLVLAVASPAAADIAPTPPAELHCQRGAVGEGTPVTSWCAPSTCEADSDCSGGSVCSSDEISFCVEDYLVATERRHMGDDPSPTRTARRVRARGCEPDGTCLNLHATCETSRRCVPADARGETAEPAGDEPAADEAPAQDEAGEHVGAAANPEEAEADHDEGASGCSCRAQAPSGAPLAAVMLLGLGLVVARVRRRG